MKNLLTDKTLKAFDSLHELQNDLVNRLNNQLEEMIIQRLADCGFKFETKAELYEFAKTRCELHQHPNHYNELFVDGKLIAYWNTEIKIDFEKGVARTNCLTK